MDDNTLAQMLGDIKQELGAVGARVGDVKDDTTYLRSSVDTVRDAQAAVATRVTVLEKEKTNARYRLRNIAVWFGSIAGAIGAGSAIYQLWNAVALAAAAGGHH